MARQAPELHAAVRDKQDGLRILLLLQHDQDCGTIVSCNLYIVQCVLLVVVLCELEKRALRTTFLLLQ